MTSEFPEGRPRDQFGVPIPTPHQLEQEAIRDARIAREQAEITRGYLNQPVAGHDAWEDEDGRQRSRRR